MLRLGVAFTMAVLIVRPCVGQEFRVDTLARGPDTKYPTSIAFTPDQSGRFFITEKNSGRVRVFDGGLLPAPFVSLRIEDDDEQGVLGVAVYPSYPDTPWIYVYYTRRIDRSNVVERFRDSAGIALDRKLVLIVPRMDDGTANNGGCLGFGPDRKLYVSVGDYGLGPAAAQDTSSARCVRGKILRLNPDGSIPRDNPFPGKPFWTYGGRNILGFTFDEGTGDLLCNMQNPGRPAMIRVARPGEELGLPDSPEHQTEAEQESRPSFSTPASTPPALAGIAVYRARAFPRLRGKVLLSASTSPIIWTANPETSDTDSLSPFFKSLGGFSDIKVAPDGSICLVNGPYLASRILRLAPIPPAFVSVPPPQAVQDSEYSYTPSFSGTPPSVSIASGPPDMTVDSSWTLHWTPTNGDAMEGPIVVTLVAENGAGSAEQSFPVSVKNVNDPPGKFLLSSPLDDVFFDFIGADRLVTFSWGRSEDPDQDSVKYIFELDTTGSFASPIRRDTASGMADSVGVLLPDEGGEYYWRVLASDGLLTTVCSPKYRKLAVVASSLPPVEAVQKPKSSALEQNYPNPFNPATSIKYTIPHAGHVRLTVFNLLGQEVARLFDGVQEAGTHECSFNRTNLPSGIYFYRIQAPGLMETKKMIVAK